MKKQLLKLTLIAAVLFSATATYAQACPEVYTVEGTYRIGVCTASDGDSATELYMTINGSTGALEWAAFIPDTDAAHVTQVWSVEDHVNPHGTGFIQITADLTSLGATAYTMVVDKTTIADANDKEFTIAVRAGTPISDDTDENYGFDQFQRRRTTGFGGPGNDALFAKPKGFSGGSRYGVVPTAAGEPVLFDGGGIDGLRFILIEEAAASVNTFNTEEFSIANPISNELTIKGSTSEINKVVVYSVLGNQVLSKSINNNNEDININVSSLATGLYIVELNGVSGQRLTKKIIKQ
ncbi:T9SS type A sorting domain-containing protein [Polaribacter sp.]|uniref:T9SS type A sorting domain-containing protein n=1 Tax=Polaribacter sp. TaxID=1920175 RepID=UPI003F69925E